ncbi:MAG: DNA translocase FtsK 4TM domain-containing protein, partial [Balneolaceae bacterium]
MPKKQNRKGFLSGLSYTRKVEIAGILIMAIAGLLFLSIVTHHPNDYGIVKSIPSSTIFSMDHSPALQVSNWLGLLGAYISYMFVNVMFGYMSVLLSVILLTLGWFVFRGKELGRLNWPAAYGLWTMILLSTIFGWFYNEFDWYSSVWSGGSGVAVAQILHNITGFGSIVILGVLFIITALILVDRDLQKTVDVIKNGMARWKEHRAEKKKLKKKRKEENIRKKREKKEKKRTPGAGVIMKDTATGPPDEGFGESLPSRHRPSVDEIVERSQREDLERRSMQDEGPVESGHPPRAILEDSDRTADGADSGGGNEEDVEISVFIGEGDEEAEDKALDRQNKDKARDIPVIKYKFPTIDLLDKPPLEGNEVDLEEIRENKRIILDKLKRHKIDILSINAIVGPTVTLYELEPAPDVKISKIQSYANDLKMATAAHGLRIIAPIPGRSAVGIEVPNSSRETVYIRSVINTKKFVDTEFDLPVAFGKTIENEVFMID